MNYRSGLDKPPTFHNKGVHSYSQRQEPMSNENITLTNVRELPNANDTNYTSYRPPTRLQYSKELPMLPLWSNQLSQQAVTVFQGTMITTNDRQSPIGNTQGEKRITNTANPCISSSLHSASESTISASHRNMYQASNQQHTRWTTTLFVLFSNPFFHK